MKTREIFADILLPLALPETLTYRLPEDLRTRALPGQRVLVGLGRSKVITGLIWRIRTDTPAFEARDVIGIVDEKPILHDAQFHLWEWMAEYYLCTPGEVMKAALPAFLKADDRDQKRVRKVKADTADSGPITVATLSGRQENVLQDIRSGLSQTPVHLLHGITSSGKTEIYIHLIREQLEQNRQVLYLLPEIALTTQMIERLEKVFGSRVLVYHSRFTQVKRLRIWNRVLDGPAGQGQLILGVRSSVFLPFRDLGLIIIDEEHEQSYKQQDPAPRYHARDVAIILGQIHKVPVLMGSATPSVESWQQAHAGKYRLHELHERFGGTGRPEILLADSRDARKRKQMKGAFTPLLLKAVDEALFRKEQVILFQNRRGYSPYIECLECHHIPKCRQCDVSLTLHRSQNKMECHYCGYVERIPSRCPACGSSNLTTRGLGTERIEEDLQLLFPEARLARLDLDSTRSANAFSRILTDFESGKTDILIGTQMISKGLDFSRVSLVGIMDADQLLNYPDFRSYERSFQLMTQVSGRAGRRDKQGTVVIQCSDPDHPVIRQVMDNDLPGFYGNEIRERRQFRYPPYSRIIRLNVKHADLKVVNEAAIDLSFELKKILANRVMGPITPPVGRIQGKHIQQILIKLERNPDLLKRKKEIASHIKNFMDRRTYGSLVIQADVDPL
jgi:primosomal protein N' (replication factor Y)